jgi:hypothetical protein
VTSIVITRPHTLRVMFKCNVCKAVCPVNAIEVYRMSEGYGPGRMYSRTSRFYSLVDAPVSWQAAPRSLVEINPRGVAAGYLQLTRCGACGVNDGDQLANGRRATITGSIMRCKTNPDHKCDPRCTGAKGHDCECSCGGANHGCDHRAGYT